MGPEIILGAALNEEIKPTKNKETPKEIVKRGRATQRAPVPNPQLKKIIIIGSARPERLP